MEENRKSSFEADADSLTKWTKSTKSTKSTHEIYLKYYGDCTQIDKMNGKPYFISEDRQKVYINE